jgi:hypothetical protein
MTTRSKTRRESDQRKKDRKRAQRVNERAARRASRKLEPQRKAANFRAKFGPACLPGPVVVKRASDLSPAERAKYGLDG